MPTFSTYPAAAVREDLLARREIALLDVREEARHAEGHPLFAANLPLSRLECEAYTRLPRRSVNMVLFGETEAQALLAARRLADIGYTEVKLLAGGLEGLEAAGFPMFIDVNVPSKAFGELVEATRHTPSLSAQTVQTIIEQNQDYVIVDVRRFDEFQTMSIPGGISVPGGELVLRIRDVAPNSNTQVIVNCAGRTRSIIGAQSLINAGLPNPVAALRNGTIGWKLAQQELAHGASKTFPETPHGNSGEENSGDTRWHAARSARCVADAAGALRVTFASLAEWESATESTIYRFDVRSASEYENGHLPGFMHAPGGQLVQETDMFAPVRGSLIVLVDDDGTRANMTASWLAQMGWSVWVVDEATPESFTATGPPLRPLPAFPFVPRERFVTAAMLHHWMTSVDARETAVLDFTPSHRYRREHIPGAWFALRPSLHQAIEGIQHARRFVITSEDLAMARFAYPELVSLVDSCAPALEHSERPVYLLDGGNRAWRDAGFGLTSEFPRFASAPADRYKRPYEGTSASPEAMQAYLDWEGGLVKQLSLDGTHHFKVL